MYWTLGVSHNALPSVCSDSCQLTAVAFEWKKQPEENQSRNCFKEPAINYENSLHNCTVHANFRVEFHHANHNNPSTLIQRTTKTN